MTACDPKFQLLDPEQDIQITKERYLIGQGATKCRSGRRGARTLTGVTPHGILSPVDSYLSNVGLEGHLGCKSFYRNKMH